MPDKTPDEIWQETGDALAELERIGKGGPDKTPASALEGVELCDRVALGMGWTYEGKVPCGDAVFYDKEDTPRFVRTDLRYGNSFRPDIDGNHEREVREECERRGWILFVTSLHDGVSFHAYSVTIMDMKGSERREHGKDQSFPLAFLRAFVAAAEAEKEHHEN